MDKNKQMEILEQFFSECLRYWEKTLKVSSDVDKQPYINAINEIPSKNPYKFRDAEEFDTDVIEKFRKYRLMDCYGKDYEKYL